MPVINTMVSDDTYKKIELMSDQYGTKRNVVEKAIDELYKKFSEEN